MNLVIDWGNTLCKWAIFNDNSIVHTDTEGGPGFPKLKEYLNSGTTIKHALLASVVHVPERELQFLKNSFELHQLCANTKLPIINLYETPQTLGSDRLAAAVGAWALFPNENALVVDAGTCIKFDFVDSTGTYLGGSIAPGITMRFRALHEFTGKLPLIGLNKDAYLTGTSTEASIQSGVMNGCVAEIDGMIDQYKTQHRNLKVILTGGDSIYFDKKLKNSIFVAPQAVFVGLNEILRCNV